MSRWATGSHPNAGTGATRDLRSGRRTEANASTLPACEPASEAGPAAANSPTRTTEPSAMPDRAPTAGSGPMGPHQHRDPGRYQILAEHGRGGLGRVSRAHDRELDRDVAIKEMILRGHVAEVRFVRE